MCFGYSMCCNVEIHHTKGDFYLSQLRMKTTEKSLSPCSYFIDSSALYIGLQFPAQIRSSL